MALFSAVLLYTADRTCTLGDVWRHSARCYCTLSTGPVLWGMCGAIQHGVTVHCRQDLYFGGCVAPFSTVLLYIADRTYTLGDVWRHSAWCYCTLLTGPVHGCGGCIMPFSTVLLYTVDRTCTLGDVWRHSARCYCTLLTGHVLWGMCGAIQHGVTAHC